MRPVVGTLAECQAALVTVRHVARNTDAAIADAMSALRAAVEDRGVSVEKVALVLAQYVVSRTEASGIDVDFWTSIAIPAAEDWDHEPDGRAS